ncbi:MAG: protease inhibitor I9 family protein, partial [Chloroflexota bacterium]
MLRLFSLAAALCALNLSFVIRPAGAAAPVPTGTVRVMIRLTGPPLAADTNLKVSDEATLHRYRLDPTSAPARSYSAALVAYQQRELAYLKANGIDVRVVRQFHILFNGFAALVPQSEVKHLQALANVAAVTPDRKIVPLDTPSLSLIHAPQAWDLLGGAAKAGRGLYIADIDTGIDMSNPCFKDTGMTPPT